MLCDITHLKQLRNQSEHVLYEQNVINYIMLCMSTSCNNSRACIIILTSNTIIISGWGLNLAFVN